MSKSASFALAALCIALLLPGSVSGATWSIGSHLGFSRLKGVKGGGATTVLTWPSNAFAYQPALRIGFGDSRRTHELQLDSGMYLQDDGGSTLTLFTGSAGYQFTALSTWPNAPFANFAVGFVREGGAQHSAVSTTWGGGVGMRHLVHDRHGALRLEGRIEYLQDADKMGRPAIVTMGVRLGFDLWL